MPADYDEIRAGNIARYGWDTAVLALLGHLYSERAHFIFELLQNAEDAGATEIGFELFADRLEVRHDGRPFTVADIRGICGVGQGAKADDLTKIGKFGIGFKAVYAYTDSPRIYSSGERFRIENYVRPYALDPPGEPVAGTLFVFPFDHPGVSAAVAVQEISAALGSLDAETLLFLRSIERVRTGGVLIAGTVLERTSTARAGTSRHIAVSTRRDAGRSTDEWLAWHRPLDALGEPGLQVEIAIRARPELGGRRLIRRGTSPLVVFFATQKETFLGFLIQGPYRTTPARDNVPEEDRWNQALVHQTASLLADVLAELRDDGMLTADVLQALPLDASRFAPGTMFRPLFESARAAVARDELIPATGGGYRTAPQVRLAGGAGLRDLLTPDLLGELCGSDGPIAFADDSITETGTPLLWRYLRDEAGVEEVTPGTVAAGLTSEFLEARSDQWIGLLYGFLDEHQALWREPAHPGDQPGAARSMPVIRLEDGTQVAPFDSRGRPAAYLPGPVPTGFPTVRRAVAAWPEARRFLSALGFAEPDVVAEVLDHVLPRYDDADVAKLDAAQHDADLELVARALAEAPQAARERLLEQLRQTTFLVGENAATGESRLMRPGELYQRSTALEVYFAGNPDAWLAADSYGPWRAQLRGMGVRESVRPDARGADDLGYVMITDDFAWHERGVAGFDPAAQLDGLRYALGHPDLARSEFVWNVLLVPSRHLVAGVVEKSHRLEFADARREYMLSVIGEAASEAAWLPAADGTFRRPAELDADELPRSYQRDDVLAHALKMVRPAVEEASRQLGFPPDFLRRLSMHPDLVAAIEQELVARARAAGQAPE
ncbi:MAG: sacsin N-terminal ATP-binding-like domain-containing protein [Streptosporangiaceae bacterium]